MPGRERAGSVRGRRRTFRGRYTQHPPAASGRVVRDEYPKEPPDVPPEHRERARELQLELLVLEARLESANFEDEEAYRRAINEREAELDELRAGE